MEKKKGNRRKEIFYGTDESIMDETGFEEHEYEEDIIDSDFAAETAEDNFDYDGERLHRYDKYTGELTPEIVLVKYEALVINLARKYEGAGAEFEELLQLGKIELARLAEENTKNPYLSNFLKRRLGRYISYKAEDMRKNENLRNRVSLEQLETMEGEEIGDSWEKREKEMFAKTKKLLTRQEMKLLYILYGGASQRQASRKLKVTHTAVQKDLKKIRSKLLPMFIWLKERAENSCTEAY